MPHPPRRAVWWVVPEYPHSPTKFTSTPTTKLHLAYPAGGTPWALRVHVGRGSAAATAHVSWGRCAAQTVKVAGLGGRPPGRECARLLYLRREIWRASLGSGRLCVPTDEP